jgi:hypothetical protein
VADEATGGIETVVEGFLERHGSRL